MTQKKKSSPTSFFVSFNFSLLRAHRMQPLCLNREEKILSTLLTEDTEKARVTEQKHLTTILQQRIDKKVKGLFVMMMEKIN